MFNGRAALLPSRLSPIPHQDFTVSELFYATPHSRLKQGRQHPLHALDRLGFTSALCHSNPRLPSFARLLHTIPLQRDGSRWVPAPRVCAFQPSYSLSRSPAQGEWCWSLSCPFICACSCAARSRLISRVRIVAVVRRVLEGDRLIGGKRMFGVDLRVDDASAVDKDKEIVDVIGSRLEMICEFVSFDFFGWSDPQTCPR